MDCRKCSEDMTAYMDGELNDSTAEQMSIHLDRCPPCRDEYRDLKDSATFVVAHSDQIDLTPELWNNLRVRIAEMPPPSGAGGIFRFLVVNRWTAALATLAATVVLAVGVWSYVQYQNSQSELEASFQMFFRTRTVAERLHGRQLVDAEKAPFNEEFVVPKGLDNPFADVRPVSLVNPFRSENR
jgi:hypothetical protein